MTSFKHVPKGWGYEKWIVNNDKYCGKLLFFEPGKKCSWHYHQLKEETFYIHSGKIQLVYGYEDDFTDADTVILKPGDKFVVWGRNEFSSAGFSWNYDLTDCGDRITLTKVVERPLPD